MHKDMTHLFVVIAQQVSSSPTPDPMPLHLPGNVVYQAQSPDEAALVNAARAATFRFESRARELIELNEPAPIGRRILQVVALLDFTNERRRMGVVGRSFIVVNEQLLHQCGGLVKINKYIIDHLNNERRYPTQYYYFECSL